MPDGLNCWHYSMSTLDIKWRSSLERYFQSISADQASTWHKAQTVAGWAGTAWGRELRELRGVAGCLQGRGCCQPKLRLDFQQDQPRLKAGSGGGRRGSPGIPKGESGIWKASEEGSRGFQGVELEGGQEVSLAGVRNSRALWEFVKTV